MKPRVSTVVSRLGILLASTAPLWLVSTVVTQTDAHLGTWVLSTGKSVYSPGPPPRSQTRVYSRDGEKLRARIETLQPLGTKTVVEYSAAFDGRDYPVSGNPDVDTIAVVRVDALTFDATLKRRGKVVSTVHNTVTKDGRIMTVTAKGLTARGQPANSVAVFVRQ